MFAIQLSAVKNELKVCATSFNSGRPLFISLGKGVPLRWPMIHAESGLRGLSGIVFAKAGET